ncbi:MAG: cytochrome c [Gemmatimonadetes bacterium]|nr:cytochrome c [Gemmatimonadota bacterium]
MDAGTDDRFLTWLPGPMWRGLAGLILATTAAAQPPADTLPASVTKATIAEGKKIFGGIGLCLACHGTDAKGGLGPDLTDAKWLHGSGTFLEIVALVKSGTDLANSKTGQIMPPMGGASLSDEQLRAVSAYVWTVSRKPAK